MKFTAHSHLTLAAILGLLAILVIASALLALPATAQAQTNDPPAKPTGLTGSVAHNRVSLSWDNPGDAGIKSYRILRRNRDVDDPGVFHIHVGSTGSSATSYTDSDVDPETRYVYRIKARNAHGLSPRSGYFNATTPAAPAPPEPETQDPPARPTGLTNAVTHDSVTLSWSDPDDGSITGYRILRLNRAEDDIGEFHVHVNNTGSAATSYTDSDVEPETRYVYRIRALNDGGESPRSSYTNADTPAAPEEPGEETAQADDIPAAPTNLFTASTHNQVVLFWQDPGDDSITGYRVLRGPGADSLTTLVDNTESAATSYTDGSVEPETTYVYALRARNSSGESGRSETVEVTTGAAPAEEEPLITAKQVAEISLVSNTGETSDSNVPTGNLGSGTSDFATSFHTGDNPDGYTLTSVQLIINRQNSDAIPQISIFTDSSGSVGTSLHTLANPSPLPLHTDSTYTLTTFTAPADTTLAANTTYWVETEAVNPGSGDFYRIRSTDSDNETSDDSTEWNIGDVIHRNDGKVAWVPASEPSIQMNIQGKLINPPDVVTILPEDTEVGTKLAASLTSQQGGVTNLTWQWARARDGKTGWANIPGATTTSYTPVYIDQGEHLRATASYDDDGGTGKATSGIIEGPPPLDLVSNTAETFSSGLDIVVNLTGTDSTDYATSFHTGDNPDGYALSSLQMIINRTDSSTIPETSIFSDSSGSVGTRLHTLTNPRRLPLLQSSSTYEFTTFAASGNVSLSANTTYWVVLTVTDTGDWETYKVSATASDKQTSHEDSGWNIGNTHHKSENRGAWGEGNTDSIQMKVQGKLINPPGVVTITPEDAEVGAPLMASVTDPDGGVTNVTWDWSRSGDGKSGWTRISGARTDSYTPIYSDRGQYLRARTFYDDNHGLDKTASGIFKGPPALGLVSNTGETSTGSLTVAANLGELDLNFATSFHTGDHAEGYAFTSVQLPINRISSEVIPIISILSDNSGTPGTSLHTLTNPSPLPLHDDTTAFELTTFAAPSNITLAANTTYWMSATAVDDGSTRIYQAGTTESDNEISSDSPEWEIGDVTHQTTDGTTWTEGSERSIQINVQGRLINPRGVVTFDQPRPNIDNLLTASFTDEDGGITNLRWQWGRSDNGETGWTNISGADSAAYTPVEADAGKYLRAVVTYTDNHGPRQRAEAVTKQRVFSFRIDFTLDPGMFAYEFHATEYEPLGDFRFQWKSTDVTGPDNAPWPTYDQFKPTHDVEKFCAMPGITREGAMECGWEYVSPGKGVSSQLATLVTNHANREYDFRIVGALREGGELFSNIIRKVVAPDLSSATERGIKAWRVDTAGHFIVEWRLAQSCDAGKQFYIRSEDSGKFAWGTGGRNQHGRLLFTDNATFDEDENDEDENDVATEVFIYCATSREDTNQGHIYAAADIAAKGTNPVLGAEQRR